MLSAPATVAWDFGLGFFTGLASCVGVGPISATILHEGRARRMAWGLLVGAGAALADGFYCTLACTGLSALLVSRWVEIVAQLVSIGLLVMLGVQYLAARNIAVPSKPERFVDRKWHPRKAFYVGLFRGLANPSVIFFWVVVSAVYASHGWLDARPLGRAAFILGGTAGVFAWFAGLTVAVKAVHRRFPDRALNTVARLTAAGLLVMAAYLGIRIFWELGH